MQFSKISFLAALSLIGLVGASPVETRNAMSCQIDVATAQSACIDNAPVGADGQADMTALTECFTAASTGYNSCPNAEKRGVMTCQTKVQSVQTECLKKLPIREDGTMEPSKIMVCTLAAKSGFMGCISPKKRDVFACADEVTARQLDCLTNAGTNQGLVGKWYVYAHEAWIQFSEFLNERM
ncbi:hypothetical protein VTL71DRAFT_7485 [Oculimacula yallundae]|uniref:Uncharacterized protein n=1 Tax=Oculimacula yallundae TaxID=86028 RepID=A0ABR4BU82_9HELO